MKIIKNYKAKIPINFEKMIHKLLAKVPKEDLVGIERINLVDKIVNRSVKKRLKSKKEEFALGVYMPKDGSTPAGIEIAVGTIYKDFPTIFYILPFIKELFFAKTLYHEIGHHCQFNTHGIPQKEWENFADNYSKKMAKKAFKRVMIILKIEKYFFGLALKIMKESRLPPENYSSSPKL